MHHSYDNWTAKLVLNGNAAYTEARFTGSCCLDNHNGHICRMLTSVHGSNGGRLCVFNRSWASVRQKFRAEVFDCEGDFRGRFTESLHRSVLVLSSMYDSCDFNVGLLFFPFVSAKLKFCMYTHQTFVQVSVETSSAWSLCRQLTVTNSEWLTVPSNDILTIGSD